MHFKIIEGYDIVGILYRNHIFSYSSHLHDIIKNYILIEEYNPTR